MFPWEGLSLGLPLMLAGLAIFLSIRLLLHQPVQNPAQVPALPDVDSKTGEAILVLSRGKVIQISPGARALFQLKAEERPDLDRLARRFRPVDGFLNACAGGQPARLVLDGRMLECTAYPLAAPSLTVIALREPDLPGPDSSASGRSLHEFMDLVTAMTSSLDLNDTVQAVMDSAARLVAADWMRVCVWDAAEQTMRPYVRFTGEERWLESASRTDSPGASRLAEKQQPILITVLAADAEENPRPGFLRSYLGVPLLRDGQLVGTIELASMAAGALRPQDLQAIQLLSGPAAAALLSACSHADRQKRLSELDGLAQLSQAFGSARDPHTLFSSLVKSILPLLPVEIMGFLLYNETQHVLEGQSPFHGLPEQFLEMYRLPVPQGSPLEKALIERDVLLTENAAEDSRWEALGLGAMGRGASLRETALIPLHSGGRMLGYLQVSNPSGYAGFRVQDLHLMALIANQAAPVIDNLILLQQQRQRAQRAEALRRVASLASSAANLEEILKYSLQELARLLQADVAAIFLLPSSGSELHFQPASMFGDREPLPEALGSLRMDDAQFHFTVTGSLRVFATGSLSGESAVIPFYQAIQSFWKIESLVAVPLIVRDQGIGELWLGSTRAQAFDAGSQQVAVTAAGQLAGVVEQSYLVQQTDESVRRRMEHLTALTRVNQELNSSTDLRYLLQRIYEEAVQATRADCGTLRFFDLERPSGGEPRTRFYIGEAPDESLDSLEKNVLQRGQLLNIADTLQAGYSGAHADILSALIVPIGYQARQAGLMVLHARTAGRFDSVAVEVAQSLAALVAVVLGNGLDHEEKSQQEEVLKRELDTFGRLLSTTHLQQPLEQQLSAVAEAIRGATPFQMAAISVYRPSDYALERICAAGLPAESWEELRTHRQPWQAVTALFLPEYRVGSAYFIPADRQPLVPIEIHTVTVLPQMEHSGSDAWDGDDLLIIPLLDRDGQPLGLISVDAPADGRRPDWRTFQSLDLFALQARLLLENDRQAQRLQAGLEQAQAELQRLEAVSADLPALIRREQEQRGQIDSLEQRVARLHSGLEVAESANRAGGQAAMLRTLAEQLLEHFQMDCALIAGQEGEALRLLEIVGPLDPAANPEALFGQRNPLHQALQDGRVLLAADLVNTPEWSDCALLERLGARSFLAMPLSESADAGVLLIGYHPLPPFSTEDEQVIGQVARQVRVGLQNLNLLTDARRRLQEMDILVEFSRRLGSLDADAILNTLLQSAMQILPAAQAGWAGLWDDTTSALTPRVSSGYNDPDSLLEILLVLPADSAEPAALPLRPLMDGLAQRVQDVQFARDYPLPAEDLLRYRRATAGKLPIANMVIPIRSGSRMIGMLVLENYSALAGFGPEDEAMTLSLAQQAALALENARLLRAAEDRAAQLQALTRTAEAISSSLRSDNLIAGLLDQLELVLPYDSASLWLRAGTNLHVSAARGFEDDKSLLGVSVQVDDSQLFDEMMRTCQPISVPDVRMDARFPAITEPEHISWLGIPLVAKGDLLGIIAVDKQESGFYTQEHIQAAITFAGQAAVALENARLFEESERRTIELDERSKRLVLLNRLSNELSSSLDIDAILRYTCQEMLSALEIDRAAAVLFDERGQYYIEEELPPGLDELPLLLPDTPLFHHLFESKGMFNTDEVADEPAIEALYHEYFQRRATHSLLMVPLLTGGNLHGWLLLQSGGAYHFSASEMELAHNIANQAAAVIQNARLFAETRRLSQDLERRVRERTSEVTREHHNSQTLLHIITELSASLDMSLVLNRTLSVLNESLGSEQSLVTLTQSGRLFHAGRDLVGVKSDHKLIGGISFEQEISRWVLRHNTTTVVEDAWIDPRWTPPQEPFRFRSALAVPLTLGENSLGTLLLLHIKPDAFSQDQVQLVEAAARQISIALNNAELFNLIRDQSEHLGSMLREQQVEASRSRAILEAVTDGIIVTDANSRIYLFNASAERILDLPAAQVMNKHLDQYGGLFGNAAADWLHTISEWSLSGVFPALQLFADRLELENGRIVEVNLAPVIMRSEFLGTVSVFRDVTHEVQVDRLKTEFVANVSHELRTPMTSIKGYVDVMLMGAAGDLDERQVHFLQIVKSNTERLSVLVNDLLDVSKIELGRVILSHDLLDVRKIASEVIGEYQRKAADEKKAVEFLLESADNLPRVEGDLERVRQIFNNLISNGYNYTPAGGQVTVRVHNMNVAVQVDVLDTGVGISPLNQNRIFERFYRGDDPLVLATAGTGLGLSITRALVEMHGGRMWFNSTGVCGEGSIFSFTLPIFQQISDRVETVQQQY